VWRIVGSTRLREWEGSRQWAVEGVVEAEEFGEGGRQEVDKDKGKTKAKVRKLVLDEWNILLSRPSGALARAADAGAHVMGVH
jgi:hypothetical protein